MKRQRPSNSSESDFEKTTVAHCPGIADALVIDIEQQIQK